jgi:hypothetical protein
MVVVNRDGVLIGTSRAQARMLFDWQGKSLSGAMLDPRGIRARPLWPAEG